MPRLDQPPIERVIAAEGVVLAPKGKDLWGLCPFHQDHEPSLVVHPEEQYWWCFACCKGGDGIAFLRLRHGFSYLEALQELGLKQPTPEELEREEKGRREAEVLEAAVEWFRVKLPSSAGEKYALSRHLTPESLAHFAVGYSPTSLSGLWKALDLPQEAGEGFGLTDALAGRLIFALRARGRVLSLYGRRVPPAFFSHPHQLAGPAHWKLPGRPAPPFGLDLARQDPVIVEAPIDACSLHGVAEAIALCGLNAAGVEPEAFRRFSKVRIWFDRATGAEGDRALTLASRLLQAGVDTAIVKPQDEDPNAFLVAHGQEKLAGALADTMRPADLACELGSRKHCLLRRLPNGEVAYDRDSYRLIIRNPAARGAGYFGQVSLWSDTGVAPLCEASLGLWNDVRRAQFARGAGVKQSTQWLLELQEQLKLYEEGARQQPEATGLGPDEEAAALAFLRSPDIIDRIRQDLSAIGVAGEEDNKVLIYLAATSRKMPDPIHLIVRGQTSTGKTFLVERVRELVPEDEWHSFGYISGRGLHYADQLNLSHVVFFVEEAPEADRPEQELALRLLMSGHRMKSLVAEKTEAGRIQSVVRQIEGPFCCIQTTTSPYLDTQQESRAFEILIDESRGQTKRIHAQVKRTHQPEWLEAQAERDAIMKKHRDASKLLRTLLVAVPYADLVSFPDSQARTRRDLDRFICLIVAIAFLRQYQKEVCLLRGQEAVLADALDYDIAWQLGRALLAVSLSEVKGSARSLLTWYSTGQLLDFTKGEAEKALGWGEYETRKAIDQLVKAGMLEESGQRRDRFKVWRVVVTDPSELLYAALKTPEELREAWARA